MSEETPKEPRASSIVQMEYGKLCAVAGDKQFRVQKLRAELDEINQKLYQLNIEFEAAQAKEAKTPLKAVEDVKDGEAEKTESEEPAQQSDHAEVQP